MYASFFMSEYMTSMSPLSGAVSEIIAQMIVSMVTKQAMKASIHLSLKHGGVPGNVEDELSVLRARFLNKFRAFGKKHILIQLLSSVNFNVGIVK